MIKEFFKIEIDGQQFKSACLVYIVKVKSEIHGEYFYVGQTGDRYHLSARPAFRRLAGHLSDQGKSTENQIYRQIAVKILQLNGAQLKVKFDIKTKDEVTEFLSKSKVEMYVYPLANFLSNVDPAYHKENRRLTERIENDLINYFNEHFGSEKILNQKFKEKKPELFDSLTLEIIDHLNKH